MIKYYVKEEFDTLCCRYRLKVGEIITVYKQPSKNRYYINADIGSHTVKKSTVNRCCELMCG